MTTLTLLKILTAGTISLVALLCSLLPVFMKTRGNQQRLLSYGESFSGGVFLSAGFVHLLPEGIKKIEMVYPNFDYPVGFLICAVTILLLRVFEKGLAGYFDRCEETQHTWLAYILVLLLSIHSVIAGAALGITASLVDLFIIGFAILAHKGAEAFALASHLRKHQLARRHMLKVLVLFALMTPLGVIMGSLLSQLLEVYTGYVAEGIFDVIAAGTFLYIATQYHFEFASELPHEHTWVHFSFFTTGLILLAVVAVWT